MIMEKVRVAQWGGRHIVYMPMYVAYFQGHFKQLGLQVELYPAGNDDQIYNEVAQGRADFGVGDPTFVALGFEKGHDCRVVAALVNKAAAWGFTHHPEIHDIKAIDDFVGLRFGVFPRPSTSFALIYNIKQRNEKRLRSMEVIETGIGELMPLLASGKVDIVSEIEPMISIAEQQGLRTVLALSDFYPPLLFTGVSTSLATIEKRQHVVENFVQGIQIGLTTCHREPEILLSVAQELFPAVSDDCMSNAIERMLQTRAWPEQALIQATSWQNALTFRQELGELGTIEEPTALLDQRFAYKAITGAFS